MTQGDVDGVAPEGDGSDASVSRVDGDDLGAVQVRVRLQ